MAQCIVMQRNVWGGRGSLLGAGCVRVAAGGLGGDAREAPFSYNGFTAFSVYCVFIVFTRNLNVE